VSTVKKNQKDTLKNGRKWHKLANMGVGGKKMFLHLKVMLKAKQTPLI